MSSKRRKISIPRDLEARSHPRAEHNALSHAKENIDRTRFAVSTGEKDFAKIAKFLDCELEVNHFGLAVDFRKIDFSLKSQRDKIDCLQLLNALFSKIRHYQDLKNISLEELEHLEKENQKLFKNTIYLKDRKEKLGRTVDTLELKLKQEEKSKEADQIYSNSIISDLENSVTEYKGREKLFNHKMRKNECEFRELQRRLSEKLEKSHPTRYKFCLNSEKLITDFRDENISFKNELLKSTTEQYETKMKVIENENTKLKNSFFEFKTNISEFVLSFKDDFDDLMEKGDEQCVLFDLQSDFFDIPFESIKDLFDDAIRTGLEFVSKKVKEARGIQVRILQEANVTIKGEQTSVLTPEHKTTKSEKNTDSDHKLEINTLSSNRITIKKQIQLIAKQNQIITEDNANKKKMTLLLSENKCLKYKNREIIDEASDIEKMAKKLGQQDLRLKRERKELELEKRFWLSKFDKIDNPMTRNRNVK